MANARLVVKDLRTSQIGPCSLRLDAGECVSMSGPSGSGKSLLLRAIADLDPHEGQVLLDHVPYEQIPAPLWRTKVSLVPVESQWWHDTVGAHFTSENCPYLELLGFDNNVFGWAVNRLSSGEKQRLALARVLMNKPQVLLLDEATASLDRKNTSAVEQIIQQYRKETDAAVIWVSHDDDQASRIGTRHYVMTDSQLREVS